MKQLSKSFGFKFVRDERATYKSAKIGGSIGAVKYLRDIYDPVEIGVFESFYVLALNPANEIIGHRCTSTGGVSATIVDAKLVFKFALDTLASGIIISHNHPSGNTKPSQTDVALTKKLKEGATLLDIDLLDHIILTEKSYYSFRDERLI